MSLLDSDEEFTEYLLLPILPGSEAEPDLSCGNLASLNREDVKNEFEYILNVECASEWAGYRPVPCNTPVDIDPDALRQSAAFPFYLIESKLWSLAEMSRPRVAPLIPPGLENTPAVLRHQRYRPYGGTYCVHSMCMRYWANSSCQPVICDYCREPGRVVYTCCEDTEDYGGHDFDATAEIRRDLSILPTWAQKAIADGCYTEDEVETILDQRFEVLVKGAEQREEFARQECEVQSFNAAFEEDGDHVGDLLVAPLILDQKEPCHATRCTRCGEGRWFETAMGSINATVNEPYKEPPRIPEYIDRPVGDARALLRGLAVRH